MKWLFVASRKKISKGKQEVVVLIRKRLVVSKKIFEQEKIGKNHLFLRNQTKQRKDVNYLVMLISNWLFLPRNGFSESRLHVAACGNNDVILRRLLDEGFDADETTCSWSACHVLAARNHTKTLKGKWLLLLGMQGKPITHWLWSLSDLGLFIRWVLGEQPVNVRRWLSSY